MKFNILLGTAVCYFGLVCQCTAFEETIEAEDLTDLLGADPSPIGSNDPWYIDYKNAKNSHIGWISNIPKTGLYEVGLFYSSNDANGRPLDLFVTYLHKSPCCNELDDRVHQFQIPQIPDNTAWDKWETEWSAPIELTKGDVHFYLNAVKEKGGPNIDKIYIRSVFEPNTCDITNGEDWCLMRDGPVETTFDDESTPEMTIPYLVSDHLDLDHITTEIYSGDCETVSAAVFDKEFLPNSPDGFKKMKLYIDLDHETLLDSDLWKNGNADDTEGDIRLCVQTEIWWDEDPDDEDRVSVSMLRTIVSQHVKLIGEFVVEEGAAEIIDEVYESDAKVEYDVEACVCDEDHEECIEDYEAKINTALNLCIWSTSNEVEILDVAQVLMEQNKDQNTKFSMKAIENYNINDLTKVDILDHKANGILKDVGHWGLVSTRLVTKWFDEEPPKELMISGTVDLQFRERRRNVRVRFEETPPQRSVKEDFHLSIKLDGGSGATSLGLLAPTVVALLGFLFV